MSDTGKIELDDGETVGGIRFYSDGYITISWKRKRCIEESWQLYRRVRDE